MNEHLASCDFALLPCPNKCQEGEKVIELLCKDMEKHTKEECPRCQYECPHCQEAGEYKEMTTKHLEECPMIEVPCPKRQCKTAMARCDLSKHRQECMFEEVPCRYSTIGCKEKLLRKDLGEHEGDTQHHLQLAVDTVHQQQSMLAKLQYKRTPVTYKFTKYDEHKNANDKVFSPAFYTGPGGYKMCIRVDANGHRSGQNAYISLYFCLMKGENDNHLSWPFTGTVTVELLNQEMDLEHYSKTLTFPPDNDASQRVVNGERSAYVYGFSRFIPHSKLGYNEAKYCQYLMDDCLYFKISVNAKKSSKTWLIKYT